MREVEWTRVADVVEGVLGGDCGGGVAGSRQVGQNALCVACDPRAG